MLAGSGLDYYLDSASGKLLEHVWHQGHPSLTLRCLARDPDPHVRRFQDSGCCLRTIGREILDD
ncbi:MAG: hypothetical protein NVSMB25_23640 [Thermoleophilaceae bacterium]